MATSSDIVNELYENIHKYGNEELLHCLPIPQPAAPRPKVPVDPRTEEPPPIPLRLQDRQAVYGFPWSDEVFAKFDTTGGHRILDTQEIMYELGILNQHLAAVVHMWVDKEQIVTLVPFCTFTSSYLVQMGLGGIPIKEKLLELCQHLNIDPEYITWWERELF
ncbi:hypothetical protein GYMLUDRAFT_258824 [Collybiopsis luxurians FD-317 M1]|nr:hypothetical protein GYMLUDRAFT_258824 [Collybiopsis luxurians FD-317 M1]